jgi:hypothetical protein
MATRVAIGSVTTALLGRRRAFDHPRLGGRTIAGHAELHSGRQSKETRYFVLVSLAVAGSPDHGRTPQSPIVDHSNFLKLAQENRIALEVMRAPRARSTTGMASSRGQLSELQHRLPPLPAESTQRAKLVSIPDGAGGEPARRGGFHAHHRSGAEGESQWPDRHPPQNAPFPVLASVEESRSEYPGLEVVIQPFAAIPNGTLAAHLLATPARSTRRSCRARGAGYQAGDLIGRTGVGRTYESSCAARRRRVRVVNAMGRRVSTCPRVRPTTGSGTTW